MEKLTYDYPETDTCPDCYGEGCQEHLWDCMKPASVCCGGCTTKVKCETCNGTGEVELEEEECFGDS